MTIITFLKTFGSFFHKSKRGILQDVAAMEDAGYSANDIRCLLQLIKKRKLKNSSIRNALSDLRDTKAQIKIEKEKSLLFEKKQLTQKKKVALLQKEVTLLNEKLRASRDFKNEYANVALVLAEDYGHAESMRTNRSVNAQGEPVPWITYPTIEYLRQIDFSDKSVFEYGSGYSTLFWAERSRTVVSVEHDESWYERMKAQMPANVEYRMLSDKEAYVSAIQGYESFDVIIIDGEHRVDCVQYALEKLAVDGLILLNNADWFTGIASSLRAANLIEIDLQGFGPINPTTWTTSLFLRRNIMPRQATARQPLPGPGSLQKFCDLNIVAGLEKPSLNGLDDKLAKYLDFQQGFFIEAGANDGFTQSNTYYLENSLGWKGILIEGIPDLAKICRKTRARSVVVNCALVADEKATPSMKMHYSNLMSIVSGDAHSQEKTQEHVRLGMKMQNIAATYDIVVPSRTLTSILEEFAADHQLNFFSLDVEGYELEVLKGLDLSKFAPQYLLIETARPAEVSALLGERYIMIEQMSVHDYFFKLQ